MLKGRGRVLPHISLPSARHPPGAEQGICDAVASYYSHCAPRHCDVTSAPLHKSAGQGADVERRKTGSEVTSGSDMVIHTHAIA
ncbi:unnamed protein product [Boreogadus saida]